jgi:hypothetical protein
MTHSPMVERQIEGRRIPQPKPLPKRFLLNSERSQSRFLP